MKNCRILQINMSTVTQEYYKRLPKFSVATLVASLVLCLVLLSNGLQVMACNTKITVLVDKTYCKIGEYANVTANVRKVSDNTPVSGHNVTFAVTGVNTGSFNSSPVATDSTGNACSVYQPGAHGGKITVTVTDSSAPQNPKPTATCVIQVIKILTQTDAQKPLPLTRRKLGIRETVKCYTEGGIEVDWAGDVDAQRATNTQFTAGWCNNTQRVTASINSVEMDHVDFDVYVPTQLWASKIEDFNLGASGSDFFGAGTRFGLSVLPSDVSFSKIRLYEEVQPDSTQPFPNGQINNITKFSSDAAYDEDNSLPQGDKCFLAGPRALLWNGSGYGNCTMVYDVHEFYPTSVAIPPAQPTLMMFTSTTHTYVFAPITSKGQAKYKADNTEQVGRDDFGPFAAMPPTP